MYYLEIRTESSVATKYFFIDDSSNGQTIETIRESLPQFYIIPSFALIIKSIYPIDACTFVISSEQKEIFRVLDFVSQQQADGFQRLLSSVNVVAEEKVIRLGGKASVLEEPQQIGVLAVYVSTNLQGCFQL